MSRPDIMPVSPDEPAVMSEGLAQLVDLARRQSVESIGVTPAALHSAWGRRRDSRRRRLAGAGLLVAAAVALAFVGFHPSTPQPEPAVALAPELPAVDVTAPESSEPPVELELDEDIVVTARDSRDARVLGPRELRLESGSYEIRVLEAATAPAVVQLPGRTLQLTRGVVVVVLAGPRISVTLRDGEAAWLAPDGTRTAIEPEPGEPGAARKGVDPTALARRAEDQERGGDRAGAIATLERLVAQHPGASAARAAVLDLARLYRQQGRSDEARCAYHLYLDRWPHAQVRGEVERALDRLGDGPACAGLQPR